MARGVGQERDEGRYSTKLLGQPWVRINGTPGPWTAGSCDEVDPDPVELVVEVVERVQPALLGTPVEPVGPARQDVFHVLQVGALLPRDPGGRVRQRVLRIRARRSARTSSSTRIEKGSTCSAGSRRLIAIVVVSLPGPYRR